MCFTFYAVMLSEKQGSRKDFALRKRFVGFRSRPTGQGGDLSLRLTVCRAPTTKHLYLVKKSQFKTKYVVKSGAKSPALFFYNATLNC